MNQSNILKRYTDMPALIYLLKHKAVTLLDPKDWDDKNDIYFLEQYKQKKGLKSLLALCFTEASETYHHWKVFAGGSSGACVTFKKSVLLPELQKQAGVTDGLVKYKMLKEMGDDSINIRDLPFIKRYGFQDECEYRLIYEDAGQELSSKDFEISLACIDRITLNPWINKSLSDAVKEIIKGIPGCEDLTLTRSTLVSSEQWKKIASDCI